MSKKDIKALTMLIENVSHPTPATTTATVPENLDGGFVFQLINLVQEEQLIEGTPLKIDFIKNEVLDPNIIVIFVQFSVAGEPKEMFDPVTGMLRVTSGTKEFSYTFSSVKSLEENAREFRRFYADTYLHK